MSGLIPLAAPAASIASVAPVLPPAAHAERDAAGASFSALLTALLPLAGGQLRSALLKQNTEASAEAEPDGATASANESEPSAVEDAAGSNNVEQARSDAHPTGHGVAASRSEMADSSPASRSGASARANTPEVTPQPRPIAERPGTRAVGATSESARMVDVSRIERDMELLAPEFRVRVERVVTRMQSEHGHRVDIVETLRHQVRQNHLYEQGRSRSGPVVTWTRSSNHTQGLAADVIIDGSHDNAAAYARLHRIAAEEGLRTLGARDPGHLELPRGSQSAGGPQLAADESSASARAGGQLEGRAPHTVRPGETRVAQVAQPAQVAAVAQPAISAVARVATVTAPRVASVAMPGSAAKRNSDTGRPTNESGPPSLPAPDLPRPHSSAYALASEPGLARTESVESGPLRPGSAERIAHLLDLQSGAPLRPLSQVLLRVDGPTGEDRIRLDLRGNAVGATLDINDPASAQRLNTRVGELQRALEGRGLEAESLRIRATPRTDTVEISRLALGTDGEVHRASAVRTTSDPSGSRDRSQDSPRDEPQKEPADSRHRSRREHKGGQKT